ncbi:helix-turn-helix transcriptional regulator [Streptomyces sp. I05A-00742]|uniref:helix-turn-helix domain-containing protein n=1 Tax=Streptomyces sp. I05A-00742 TaxID=2732853 RepID=UPI002017BD39|nr:helix-turn-helix transcriptional regulator [Streptomyces sp. I05A-00742]
MRGMTDHKAFGSRVRFYRERRRLTQRELGALLCRSEGWVYRVESGRIPVNTVKMLMDIAEALRVHLEDVQGAPSLLDDRGNGRGNDRGSVPAMEEWWWRHVTHRQLFRVLDARARGLPWVAVRQLMWLERCGRRDVGSRQSPSSRGELAERRVE